MDRANSGSIHSRRQFLVQGAGLGLGLVGGLASAAESGDPSAAAPPLSVEFFPGALDSTGAYALGPLPYGYNALEPYIDEETMHLHHDKHHAAYVKGLVDTEDALAKAHQTGDYERIQSISQKLAFFGGGHFLHCLYWASMAPQGKGGLPSADLAKAIETSFGSMKVFQDQLFNAARTVEGSGWALLAWSVAARKLVVLQAEKHNNATQWAELPLLALDVWEHAYYKKYGPDRAGYIKAFTAIIDWQSVSDRYAALRKGLG